KISIRSPSTNLSLSKYCKNSTEELSTPTKMPLSPTLQVESNTFSTCSIFPFLEGMGSPWGSNPGKHRCLSSFSTNCSLCTCSNCSATSCTSSQANSNFSTRNTSHKRCFLIMDRATSFPSSVKETPLYFL